jgi:hypothetical protein
MTNFILKGRRLPFFYEHDLQQVIQGMMYFKHKGD